MSRKRLCLDFVCAESTYVVFVGALPLKVTDTKLVQLYNAIVSSFGILSPCVDMILSISHLSKTNVLRFLLPVNVPVIGNFCRFLPNSADVIDEFLNAYGGISVRDSRFAVPVNPEFPKDQFPIDVTLV